MNKIFTRLSVIIIVFIVACFIGYEVYDNISKVNNKRDKYETPEVHENKNVSYIKETDEFVTRGLFEYMNDNSYELNLMANDMTWNQESRLYYKIIKTKEDYDLYDSRIGLPEIGIDELKTKSIVVVASENVREVYERDLYIAEVEVDGDISHIILKQKENPNFDCDNNVFVAIIDNDVLKEKIIVDIK